LAEAQFGVDLQGVKARQDDPLEEAVDIGLENAWKIIGPAHGSSVLPAEPPFH
jgi:hypothetical protein